MVAPMTAMALLGTAVGLCFLLKAKAIYGWQARTYGIPQLELPGLIAAGRAIGGLVVAMSIWVLVSSS